MANRTHDPQRQLALQNVLDDFGNQPGVLPVHVHNLEFIIQHTPALRDAMQQAAEEQTLQRIEFLDPQSNSSGSYHAGTLRAQELDFHFVGNASRQEIRRLSLISTVAHETQHALNSSRDEEAKETFRQEITTLAQSGQPVIDYTQPLLKRQQADIWNEATAEIAAWNAAVSYLQHQNPQQPVALQEIYSKYERAAGFVSVHKAPGQADQYTMKPGFVLNADMTLDAANPANMQAMQQYYFDPSFSMGECGNADYRNLYARRALLDVQQAHMEHAAPGAKMMLDMSALKLSERLLEESGMPVLATNGQMPYVDRQTPQVDRFFDHTYQPPTATPQQTNPQAFQYIDNGNNDPYTLPSSVPQCQRPAAGATQQTGGSPRVAHQAQATGELSFFDKLMQAAQSGDTQALLPAAQSYMQTQEAQDWFKQGQQQLQQQQQQQEQATLQQQAQEAAQQQSAPVMRM